MKTRKFFKWLGMVLAGVIIILCVGYLFLPKGPRETMEFDDPYRTERTQAESDQFMASTGTPWATETALKIMKEVAGKQLDAELLEYFFKIPKEELEVCIPEKVKY